MRLFVTTADYKTFSCRVEPSMRVFRSVRVPHCRRTAQEWAKAVVDAMASRLEEGLTKQDMEFSCAPRVLYLTECNPIRQYYWQEVYSRVIRGGIDDSYEVSPLPVKEPNLFGGNRN